jgi:lysophospholipase L1-like esterase
MMKLSRVIPFFLFLALVACSQKPTVKPPFWDDIQAFKRQDSINMPAKNEILFIGSSSFTIWQDVQSYFPSYPIINRGFGGSSLPDVTRYREDVIFKYSPKQIFIYCGENDFAASDTVSVPTVVGRFKELFTLIREKLKDIPIVYISMKPSPSRAHLMPKFVEANNIIRDFLSTQPGTTFLDVYHSMLKPDGTPMDDIFREDRLHMTAKGYAIWQKLIEPLLLK